MLKKIKELKSLLNARAYSLKQAEERVEELSTLKNYYKNTANEQRETINIQDKTINKQNDLINKFIKELYSNIKGDKQKVSKLKELVRDYQSLN